MLMAMKGQKTKVDLFAIDTLLVLLGQLLA